MAGLLKTTSNDRASNRLDTQWCHEAIADTSCKKAERPPGLHPAFDGTGARAGLSCADEPHSIISFRCNTLYLPDFDRVYVGDPTSPASQSAGRTVAGYQQ
jgi:hypothetical protein